jgi:hypothetical protein
VTAIQLDDSQQAETLRAVRLELRLLAYDRLMFDFTEATHARYDLLCRREEELLRLR